VESSERRLLTQYESASVILGDPPRERPEAAGRNHDGRPAPALAVESRPSYSSSPLEARRRV